MLSYLAYLSIFKTTFTLFDSIGRDRVKRALVKRKWWLEERTVIEQSEWLNLRGCTFDSGLQCDNHQGIKQSKLNEEARKVAWGARFLILLFNWCFVKVEWRRGPIMHPFVLLCTNIHYFSKLFAVSGYAFYLCLKHLLTIQVSSSFNEVQVFCLGLWKVVTSALFSRYFLEQKCPILFFVFQCHPNRLTLRKIS